MCGGVVNDTDLFGYTYLSEFYYTGVDGAKQVGRDFQGNSFDYFTYVTGNETGRVMLYVMAKTITFKASLGEIAFSEDYNAFTFEGKERTVSLFLSVLRSSGIGRRAGTD